MVVEFIAQSATIFKRFSQVNMMLSRDLWGQQMI